MSTSQPQGDLPHDDRQERLRAKLNQLLADLKIEGVTQKSLAKELGVHPVTVSRWANGDIALGLDVIADLCGATGRSIHWFLDEAGTAFTRPVAKLASESRRPPRSAPSNQEASLQSIIQDHRVERMALLRQLEVANEERARLLTMLEQSQRERVGWQSMMTAAQQERQRWLDLLERQPSPVRPSPTAGTRPAKKQRQSGGVEVSDPPSIEEELPDAVPTEKMEASAFPDDPPPKHPFPS